MVIVFINNKKETDAVIKNQQKQGKMQNSLVKC